MSVSDPNDEKIVGIAQGLPGPLSLLAAMESAARTIDPESRNVFGQILFTLEHYNFVGEELWDLHTFLGQGDTAKTVAVVRALQLEVVRPGVLREAIAKEGEGFELAPILQHLRQWLPRFGAGITA